VDLLERDEKFIEEAKKTLLNNSKIGNFYCFSLENFIAKEQYDCIWIQWVFH